MLVTTGCPDEAIDSASGAVSVTASPARTVMPAALAISSAARRRSKRSVWSGQTHASNQRASASSVTSTGCWSMPRRVAIVGHRRRDGDGAPGPALELDRRRRRADRSAGLVAVPVAVEEQIEPGARPDVEVGERADLGREQPERGQQQRAAADLVGLGAAGWPASRRGSASCCAQNATQGGEWIAGVRMRGQVRVVAGEVLAVAAEQEGVDAREEQDRLALRRGSVEEQRRRAARRRRCPPPSARTAVPGTPSCWRSRRTSGHSHVASVARSRQTSLTGAR